MNRCDEQIDERRDSKITVPHITSWLLKTGQKEDDVEATNLATRGLSTAHRGGH